MLQRLNLIFISFLSHNRLFTGIALLCLLQALSLTPEANGTQDSSPEPPLCIKLGNPAAPVRITEYSSLTCGFCSEHHKNVMPTLQKEFIDKGKVRYLIVEFPLDTVGLELAQVIYAQPEQQRYGLRAGLMHNQQSWLLKHEPKSKAIAMLRLAGVSEAKAKSALADESIKRSILQQRLDAEKKTSAKITATPTFVIERPNAAPVILEGYNPPGKFLESVQTALSESGGAL